MSMRADFDANKLSLEAGAISADLVAQFLVRPCEPVLDLDGTLLAHDLSYKPEVQRELLALVIQGVTSLQASPAVIATNKTLAELSSLVISGTILFTENCSVLLFPKEIEAQVAAVFPDSELSQRDGLGIILFGGNLEHSIEQAASMLSGEFKQRLSGVFGREDWLVVAATRALDPRYPEVSIKDVGDSFGLTQELARESASRQGNTGIFIKTLAGELIPFSAALGKVVAQESGLWDEICQRGQELGISLTPSSKAISITSSKSVRVNAIDGEVQLPVGKGLAIELQRKLSGGRPVFFAGDAGNDIPGVERLRAGDLFCQMKAKAGFHDSSLVSAARKAGCLSFLSPDAAPAGVALLVAAALSAKSIASIDHDSAQLSIAILAKLKQWEIT